MAVNPYIAAGGLLAGVLVLDSLAGTHVLTRSASAAGAAAAAGMPSSVAGVPFEHDPNPQQTFVHMRRALIARFGQLAGLGQYPANMNATQLGEVCDAWLASYRAGRDSDPPRSSIDFSLVNGSAVDKVFQSTEAYKLAESSFSHLLDQVDLSPLGEAITKLVVWRRELGEAGGGVDDHRIIETFTRVLRAATELMRVGYTFPGLTPTELLPDDWDTIAEAFERARDAAVGFARDLLGDAAGAVAGAIVGSPLFWAAALGVIVWRVR